MLLSKVIPSAVPSAVLKREAVMCSVKKARDLDKFPAGKSHRAVGRSSTLVSQHYQLSEGVFKQKHTKWGCDSRPEKVVARGCWEQPPSAPEQRLPDCDSASAAGGQNPSTVNDDDPLTCEGISKEEQGEPSRVQTWNRTVEHRSDHTDSWGNALTLPSLRGCFNFGSMSFFNAEQVFPFPFRREESPFPSRFRCLVIWMF